ncbi:MAG TPA: glycosyltransferase family 2 protein [Thermoanaerobaculia bacterium]|nr:glycosyltransferase family 2 protein [Thermoanaerobaculia bacterium]
MTGGWWLAGEVAILAAWLLSLGRTIVNLALVPRLRAGRALPLPRTASTPLVSVIIPARDEERSIERTVRAFLAQTWPALEIVVINDRSTDSTGALLAQLATEDSRVHVIDNEEPPEGWLGKPWALHQGSLRAHGELLLFVDADVIYEPDAVAAAVTHLEARGVPMLSLFPHFVMRGFWEHVLMPNLAFFAFTAIPLWLSNRSRTPLLGIGGGTGNLIRRVDYDAIGGHVSLRDAVVDDVALARLTRRSGRRTEIARAEDLVSVRMYEGLSEIVQGFTKNAFATVGRSYIALVFLLALGFVLHVLPFALAFTGSLFAIATVVVITLTRVILFSAIRYRLDNALLGHPLMVSAWALILLRSAWFTGIRKQLLWRGRTYDARRTRFGAD